MQFLISLVGLALATRAIAEPSGNTAPTITPAPVKLEIRQTSEWLTLASTEIANDQYSVGVGQNGTGGPFYYASCLQEPFTTYSSFAGCGTDDMYTRCSGRTALGLDGRNVVCTLHEDHTCGTFRIYADTEVTMFTTMLGCMRGVTSINLLRGELPTTGASSPTTTTTSRSGSSAVETAAATTTSGDSTSDAPSTVSSTPWVNLISVMLASFAVFF